MKPRFHKSTIPCIAWHFQITRQYKINQFACMVMVGELDNTEQTVCGSAWLEQYSTISYSQPYPYGTKVTKSSKKCRSNAQIVSCVEISIKPDIMHANASTACIFLHIICTWLPEIGSRLCTTEKGEMCDNLLCATCDKVRKPVACFTKPTTRFTKSVQHFCVIFSIPNQPDDSFYVQALRALWVRQIMHGAKISNFFELHLPSPMSTISWV